jgi:hypothetical protein
MNASTLEGSHVAAPEAGALREKQRFDFALSSPMGGLILTTLWDVSREAALDRLRLWHPGLKADGITEINGAFEITVRRKS